MSLQQLKKIRGVLADGIENLVRDKKCGYIEAAVLYCSTNNIDIDHAAMIISNNHSLTTKIEQEATSLNFLKK